MLIINQWATNAASYITEDIVVKLEEKDNIKYSCLIINGECFARSENYNLIERLNYKLHSFIDRAKRTTDTFDIGVEMEIILDKI